MSSNEPKIEISASTLKEMFLEIIREARKPVLTDREIKDIEQLQEERRINAANVKQEMQNRRNLRQNCSHMRRDGTCRAVYVKGSGPDSGNFMICQYCQAIIHPGVKPKDYDGEHFYDNTLFNKLFQAAGAAEILE